MLNMQMQREKCAFCVTIPTQDPLIADASFDLIFGALQKIIIFQRKEFVGKNIVMILVFRSTFVNILIDTMALFLSVLTRLLSLG